MGKIKSRYRDPENYYNRELSWLLFDRRILGEAEDVTNRPFERMKFLSITASNLDEFFMVRVASLKALDHVGDVSRDAAGMTPKEQLSAISGKTHEIVEEQYRLYNEEIRPILAEAGVPVVGSHEKMTEEEREYADRFFAREVYPVLTPMAVDSGRPFPLIRNRSLNLAILMRKKGETADLPVFAMVRVPDVLNRAVELPGGRIIYLEEIIERNIGKLFLNYDIIACSPFRIMRSADMSIEEDDTGDLLQEIEQKLRERQWGDVIRLDIDDHMDFRLLEVLRVKLSVGDEEIYRIPGPLDLTVLEELYGRYGRPELMLDPFTPQPVPELMNDEDIFANIRKGDILLSHPYESFEPVIRFIRRAAKDPDVLAIKQTLYRVSGRSPIIAALAEAADNGKQVSVLLELKARFDEENNIAWAKMLEKAGCHVIYGLVGLKTHGKITLVVRRDEDGIRRYVHLGTGNYNDSTAKLYTDFGLLTCDPEIGEDASAFFNMLSGYSEPLFWNCLSIAPLWLRKRFLFLIDREAKNAAGGRTSGIIAKMNSLCDREIIEHLYAAGAAGVPITLIVRGICSLRAGVPGLSENITVISIVGDYLEHARVFRFENAGDPQYYMASSDWMPRNLDRRVEIMFPIRSPELRVRVQHMLEVQLSDNTKLYEMRPDGSYGKRKRSGKRIVAQEIFRKEAVRNAKAVRDLDDPVKTRTFVPRQASQGKRDRKKT